MTRIDRVRRQLTPGLERLGLDPVAREILQLAGGCGLRPRISPSGSGYRERPTEVIIDSRKPGGLFGTITIGTGGDITCAHLVHGNRGDERRFDGPAEVRTVIASWAIVTGAPVAAP